MERNLYLFDFDGTLTNVDTLFDFLKFSFPKSYKKIYLKHVCLFLQVKMDLKDAGEVKEKFIATFLKDKSRDEISFLSKTYFDSRKSILFREKAIDYIKNLPEKDEKYIVSASLDIWVESFANYLGLELICTKAKFDENGIFTGEFASKNCNYEEKKKRIETEINLEEFQHIVAFGDSRGDKEMFSVADQSFFKYFE